MSNDNETDRLHIWLFVNHLGEFRYVHSINAPEKMFVYEKNIHHIVEREPYHGSATPPPEIFYMTSDKKVYYYGFYQKCHFVGECTNDKSYFEPEIIGTLLPACFVPEKYKNMTFADMPVDMTDV